jgi:hypothetical protein
VGMHAITYQSPINLAKSTAGTGGMVAIVLAQPAKKMVLAQPAKMLALANKVQRDLRIFSQYYLR